MHGWDKKLTQNFSEKPEGNRSFMKHKHRCENNIKIDLTEIRCEECRNYNRNMHFLACLLLPFIVACYFT